MKKELLALAFIAALPGCGCWRKEKPTAEPKKAKAAKAAKKAKAAPATKGMRKGAPAAKEHMDDVMMMEEVEVVRTR